MINNDQFTSLSAAAAKRGVRMYDDQYSNDRQYDDRGQYGNQYDNNGNNGYNGYNDYNGYNGYNDSNGYNGYNDQGYGRGRRSNRTGFAIAGFVLGIVSIVACCSPIFAVPCGIVGLILSILGLRSDRRVFAIIGIVLSAIGMLVGAFMLMAVIFTNFYYYYYY